MSCHLQWPQGKNLWRDVSPSPLPAASCLPCYPPNCLTCRSATILFQRYVRINLSLRQAKIDPHFREIAIVVV
jgi:hypothetical protein